MTSPPPSASPSFPEGPPFPADFPPGFFDRADPTTDDRFYEPDRFVTHIDDNAIAEVGRLYDELGLDGKVLDLMSSWVSHFLDRPDHLVALGMNANELAGNEQASEWVVHDLNADPTLPFEDESFDAATCCVSIDYLVRPVEVLTEVARVLKPGGLVVLTFSNRCFPTKAIRGWLMTDDRGRVNLVRDYLRRAGAFGPSTAQLRTPLAHRGDPLYAIWAPRL